MKRTTWLICSFIFFEVLLLSGCQSQHSIVIPDTVIIPVGGSVTLYGYAYGDTGVFDDPPIRIVSHSLQDICKASDLHWEWLYDNLCISLEVLPRETGVHFNPLSGNYLLKERFPCRVYGNYQGSATISVICTKSSWIFPPRVEVSEVTVDVLSQEEYEARDTTPPIVVPADPAVPSAIVAVFRWLQEILGFAFEILTGSWMTF